MYTMKHLPNAVMQFNDNPISYNPLIARALGSTKSAIVLDFLNCNQRYHVSRKQLGTELSMSSHEVETVLTKLFNAGILKSKLGTIEIDPFFMDTITYISEGCGHIENHLEFDLLRSVDINRLHLKAIRDEGGSINAVILLSFLLSNLSDDDKLDRSKQYSDWFESHDTLWTGLSGMTSKEIRNAKLVLKKLGLVELRKEGFPAQVLLRINIQYLMDMTWSYAQKLAKTVEQTKYSKTQTNEFSIEPMRAFA